MNRREFFLPLFASGMVLSRPGLFSMPLHRSHRMDSVRSFHASISSQGWEANPDLPSILRDAGITDIWLGAFFYGRWYRSVEELQKMTGFLEREGFRTHLINLPLGHPGDALGLDENTENLALPPPHWKNCCTYDGQVYSGTSIHAPAVKENREAIVELFEAGYSSVFLDDDFRVGRMPGHIGGCFCDECRNEFMNTYAYGQIRWKVLLDAIEHRKYAPELESWVEFICDRQTGMFNELQNAAPDMQLGNMIMYLGSEKAGIELERYRDVPFRVGEFMFDDKSFSPVKGKTDELFSSLFHRRFARPELAFSETTAYPHDALSARNIAAKLTVSLISDVRNTMFMSGLHPFPVEHWSVLKPAMQKSAELHKEIAGHRPDGPFKHFWGRDSRILGRDKPFSLFLASGIPFEVEEEISGEGWYFLSDEDARAVTEGRLEARGRNLLVRSNAGVSGKNIISMDEKMEDIMVLKRKIIPELGDTPYVDGDVSAVFSWYPDIGKAILWNVNEEKQSFQIKRAGKHIRTVSIDGLDVALIPDIF